ncbi:MAG: ATP-binding protein [Oscillospiraceae bacterium]|nr:ATP-binding protein [Oscillospiraceae bacterium]
MSLIRKYVRRAFGGRLLYAQVLYVVIAFAIMVAASYIFAVNIERGHLEREVVTTFSNIESQFYSDLQELNTFIGVISENALSMLTDGAGFIEMCEYLTYLTVYGRDVLTINGLNGVFASFDVFDPETESGFSGAVPDINYWVELKKSGFLVEDRLWYIAAVEANGEIVMTEPYVDVVSDEMVFSYARAIFDDNGERLAIIGVTVSLDRIYDFYRQNQSNDDVTWMLLDKSLTIVVFPHNEFVGMPLADAHETGLSHIAANIERDVYVSGQRFISYEGVEKVHYVRPLENGWHLGVSLPVDYYNKNLFDMMLFLIVSGLALSLILSTVLIRLVASRNRAEERMRLMFDASPLGISFWDENSIVTDCNMTTLKFFGLKNKQEYIDRFFEFTPEFQPDGKSSVEKKTEIVKTTLEQGNHRCEWMAQMTDGTLVPVELTSVRAKHMNAYVVIVYSRSLRDEKAMAVKIAERNKLLRTVNRVATTLLSAKNEDSFEESLLVSMEFICNSTDADSIHLWHSELTDDGPYLTRCYEWHSEILGLETQLEPNTGVAYDSFPELQSIIASGEPIHGPITTMPAGAHEFFSSPVVKSFVLIPLFLHDRFWGLFTLDNSRNEQTFSNEELNILRSAGLMIMNAVNRNDMLEKINEEHEKSENLAHWYHTILDAIPLPISVTDENMNWTFVNSAVERFLGMKRKDMMGWHCSTWGAEICNTSRCSIECFRRGINQTLFTFNNLSFKANVEMLRDLNGESAGFIEVFQDITEVETMAKRQAEIEAASNAKSAFLATVSHEIRTPMNTILGIAEIQLQSDNHTPEVEEAFTQISDSGDLLLNIINDILDLSKIEAGKLDIVPGRYDIPSLVNDNVQLNYLRYESKPIKLTINLDKDMPLELFGDEFRIKQILNNLLSNAFKYTDEGEVELSVWPTFKTIDYASKNEKYDVVFNLRVSDTGVGMTVEEIDKLFDEFSRFSTNRTTVGTGLGMSITKRLIDMMNGNITVESTPAKGSVFTVSLPQKLVSDAVCGAELSEKFRSFNFKSRARLKKTQIVREYMPYGSVLIVDDVTLNLQVAKGMMLPYALRIETVLSGIEAVEMIKAGKEYDIVFMDHMMPFMNGIEATKVIRDLGYSKTIVALTANALAGQEEIFLKNGFDGFISKPIDSRELNLILNEHIRNKKPREIVEAARKEQRERENKNNAVHPSGKIKTTIPNMGKYFAKDAEHAVSVLEKLFAEDHPLSDDDIELYVTTVHGIKSSLANIGEEELSKVALNLEHSGKKRDLSVMWDKTPVFVSVLKSLIDKYKPEDSDDIVDVSEEDLAFLREKLLAIKAACDSFDKQTVKATLNELKQKLWSEGINEALEKIDSYLLHSAFEKAAEVATETADFYY